MSVARKRNLFSLRLPLVGTFLSAWNTWREERMKPRYRFVEDIQARADLRPYPIDLSLLLALPDNRRDRLGILSPGSNDGCPITHHPVEIAQYALAYWNAYLAHGEDEQRSAFLKQARSLLEGEVRLSAEIGLWPVSFPLPAYHVSQPCLSAIAQGSVLSVFVRAYQLTCEEPFLHAAQRAAQTFKLDILDGGVQAPVGEEGSFFEEIAAYPASHSFKGHLLALLGLYDYLLLTREPKIEALIQQGVESLHNILMDFDTGYWTRSDLLHGHLAFWADHSLHVILLRALASYSGCEHCASLALRWESYPRRLHCCMRYLFVSRITTWGNAKLKPLLRRLLFCTRGVSGKEAPLWSICVPITAFPVAGGMRGVVTDVAQVMSDQWKMTYLTHHKGQGANGLDIEIFGLKRGWPGQFPTIWLYSLAGGWKLFRLLRNRPNYALLLPQDGAFTGAFAALLGKMAGIRVVCMDHGNVTWFDNPAFRQEQMQNLRTGRWLQRLLKRLCYTMYWPSLYMLIRLSARYTDQFLVAGDEVAEVYKERLGISARKISRYVYMVDPDRFSPPDRATCIDRRKQQGIAADALVITLINRLAPEKGLSFALEGIAQALTQLAPEIRSRVRVLIAGSGPLRSQLEMDIQRYGMDEICLLWGEARPADVVLLLSISDVFLYTGIRGTNYSVAILEAMAAGCAVIASNAPQSNSKLLADGRGIVVTPGKAAEIGAALVRLCNDPALRQRMGEDAREYILANHTATMLKRNLLRISYFMPPLDGV